MRILTLFTFILFSLSLNAQELASIRGKIHYSDNGRLKPIEGVSVYISDLKRGAFTDEKGAYAFAQVPRGKYEIIVDHIAYEKVIDSIDVRGSVSSEKREFSFTLERKAFQIDELTVKASRVAANGPFTHTNINNKELEARNLGQDVPYLLRWTPSTVVTSDAGTGIGYTGLRIRGSDPSRVNVTINGIPINDSESQLVFWVNMPDFASSTNDIQIQRGVGTSTNGAGAFGGTVNLNTTKVNNRFGEVNASVGSFGTTKFNGMFSTGLLADKFVIDGRVSKIDSDGFIDRGSSDLLSGYLSAAYVGEKSSLRLNAFSGFERTYQAWCGVPAQFIDNEELRTFNPCGLQDEGTFYDDQVDDYNQSHFQLIYNSQVTNRMSLNVAGHYTRGLGHFEEWRDKDDLATYLLPNAIVDGEEITEGDIARRRWLDNHFYGGVFSLNYISPNGKLEITPGGGYNIYQGAHYGEVVFSEFGVPANHPRYYDNDATKTDFNAFAKIKSRISAKVSGYLDLQVRSVGYEFLGFDQDGNNVTQDDRLGFFNPKVGAVYELNDNSNIYASFAIGNREPNRNDYTETTPFSRPSHETLRDLEIGFRRNYSKAAFEITAYNMDYTNQLVLTGQVNDVGEYSRVNVEDSYRRGIELVGGFKLTDMIEFQANATFSQNKIESVTEGIDNWSFDPDEEEGPGNERQFFEDHEDTDLAFSPSVIAGGQLSFDILRKQDNHDLKLNLMGKYVGEQFFDNTSNPNFLLDDYFFTDLQAQYTFKSGVLKAVTLNFLVQNVFDSQFISNAWSYRFLSPGFDPTPTDFYSVAETRPFYHQIGYYPQAGRNFLVGLKVRI